MSDGTATESERIRRQADLLLKTSRTFALSIPLLPEPTRDQVQVAYLLFRIADTFEDGVNWSREARRQALADFVILLRRDDRDAARRLADGWREVAPIDHAGYLELLDETPSVLATYWSLDPPARAALETHLVRTAEGMAGFVGRTDDAGTLQLASLQDLRVYCYVVAGIVGEMLTELFLLATPALGVCAEGLRSRSAAFGEGLQLTNILKDSSADNTEGRSYLPASTDRDSVFQLARSDLDQAATYTNLLQSHGAPRGTVAFNALPVLLARATLERVQRQGPGAKITRSEVYALLAQMNTALDEGRPAV